MLKLWLISDSVWSTPDGMNWTKITSKTPCVAATSVVFGLNGNLWGGDLLFIIIKHNFVQPFFVADLGEVGDKVGECFDNQKLSKRVFDYLRW